jgi:hypothetical protein
MVMEYGEDYLKTLILVNGSSLKLMVMVFIHGRMVIGMRVNGRWHLNMVVEQISSLMVRYTLVNLKKENIMVKVNTLGAMVQFI